jgi:regulator of replication initiation timing
MIKKMIDIEYKRLKSLFSLVDEIKKELVDNLIYQAAFMKVELTKLQEQMIKYGAIQISSKGAQRQTEAAKYYTKLVNSYGTVIKTLNSILGTQVMEMMPLMNFLREPVNELSS